MKRALPLSVLALSGCHDAASSAGAAPLPAPEDPPILAASLATEAGAGGAPRVVELSLAGNMSFALYSDGTVRAWGEPAEPQFDAVSMTFDGKLRHDTPVKLEGLTGVRQISAGSSHACVVGDDALTRCWGLNLRAVLGDGTRNHLEPFPLKGGEGAAEVQAAGAPCVRYEAGEARCMSEGALKPVTGLGAVQRLSANLDRGCAIRTNGTLACWGAVFGRDMPYATYYWADHTRGDLYHASAVEVRGLQRVRALSLMERHVCAIARMPEGTDGDELYCWGVGGSGQLGTGKSGDGSEPTSYQEFSPRRVKDIPPIEAVAAGYDFTCAVTTEGKAMCWGDNGSGQLGVGDTKRRARPAEVAGVDRLVQIAAGWRHACALRSDGAVFCWGSNERGQVGAGDAGPGKIVTAPVAITALDSPPRP